MNCIILTGNLTHEWEVREFGDNKSVYSNSIAVRHPFKKDHTDFFPINVWNQQGENMSKYTEKGHQVNVMGQMRQHRYEDKNGNKRERYIVDVQQFTLLNNKKDGEEGSSAKSTKTNSKAKSSKGTEEWAVQEDEAPW